MENKLVAGIVAAAIAVIVLAGVLMPALTDATTTEDTFINEGYFRMAHFDDTTDHVVTWTYEKPNIVTVDGDDVTINYSVKNGSVTVIADTNWIVRMYYDNTGAVTSLAMVVSTGGTASANVSSSHTATINLTSGSMSATMGTASRTGTYSDIWIPSNSGEFLMKDANKKAYINGDSQIVGYGMTRVNTHTGALSVNPGYGLSFVGDYDDGIVGTIWRGGSAGVEEGSLSDIKTNAAVSDNHKDLYIFDKITATFTLTEYSGDDTFVTTTDITYNYVIVPYQVTADRTVQLSSAMSTILNVVPILIIVAVLLGVVAIFIIKRE